MHRNFRGFSAGARSRGQPHAPNGERGSRDNAALEFTSISSNHAQNNLSWNPSAVFIMFFRSGLRKEILRHLLIVQNLRVSDAVLRTQLGTYQRRLVSSRPSAATGALRPVLKIHSFHCRQTVKCANIFQTGWCVV